MVKGGTLGGRAGGGGKKKNKNLHRGQQKRGPLDLLGGGWGGNLIGTFSEIRAPRRQRGGWFPGRGRIPSGGGGPIVGFSAPGRQGGQKKGEVLGLQGRGHGCAGRGGGTFQGAGPFSGVDPGHLPGLQGRGGMRGAPICIFPGLQSREKQTRGKRGKNTLNRPRGRLLDFSENRAGGQRFSLVRSNGLQPGRREGGVYGGAP